MIEEYITASYAAKPVQRLLLIPLAIVLFLLVGSFASLFLNRHQNYLNQSSEEVLDDVKHDFSKSLIKQSEALEALQDVLIDNPILIEGLRALDRKHLLAAHKNIFSRLLKHYGITHFYFHRSDRINLLRVHKPDQYGDLIDRFTAVEAERTGKTASGIELGPLGTFTLRVVRPIYDGGLLIGYLELGKEIEDILIDIGDKHNLTLAVIIKKSELNRIQWEMGMEMLGRNSKWNQFSKKAIIYYSGPEFPSVLDRLIERENIRSRDRPNEANWNGRSWNIMFSDPLTDVSGVEVGDLIIMHDISGVKAAFTRTLCWVLAGALALLVVLFSFLYTILRQTDRRIRRQEAILIANQERYDQLAERNRTFTWEVDSTGLYTYVSKAIKEILGYSHKELVGKRYFYDLCPESERDALKATTFKVFSQKAPFDEYLNQIQAKDGHCLWVSTSAIPVLGEDGKLLGYRGTDMDITNRRQVEKELRFLSLLTEQISDACLATDLDYNIVYANRAFEKLFGYSREELQNCSPNILNAELQSESIQDNIYQTISSGETWTGEVENLKKDGTKFCCDLAVFPLRDEHDNIFAYAALQRDVSQRKQSEQELISAKEVAVAAAKAKSEFLANMSHEIRTPISGILGMTEELLESELSEDQKELTGIIEASGNLLLGVVNDILDYSKIEAGRFELSPIAFDLRKAIEELRAILRVRIEQRGLQLEISIDKDTPQRCFGDPDRLLQILINLIGNSIKFTGKGGSLTLLVKVKEQLDDSVLLQFNVIDTGIGIPEDKQRKIFEAFSQADTSTTRRFGGTGLGLSISLRLVRMMGGEMSVTSTPGTGSNFCFTARFGTVAEGDLEQESETVPYPVSRALRILLCEDNEINQRYMVRVLEKAGHTVEVAHNGKEAVEIFDANRFDLILMDIQMPIMGGEEATALIRKKDNGGQIPIIALTAHAMPGDKERYLRMGLDGYVSKPINRKRLFAVMEELTQASD